ncbi:hypothetical protein EX30DRAFT_348794 [Ascodesmis nigricans]|uniref:DUF7514 domain-containing protein n=1 Tax=Ascodesmis nigricans TaxID=341454 RepID=A0A4V3SIS0_9PEZI|nr:hypothetical protein EX30DRAFT_348794 [Ascodesmis nigricans]
MSYGGYYGGDPRGPPPPHYPHGYAPLPPGVPYGYPPPPRSPSSPRSPPPPARPHTTAPYHSQYAPPPGHGYYGPPPGAHEAPIPGAFPGAPPPGVPAVSAPPAPAPEAAAPAPAPAPAPSKTPVPPAPEPGSVAAALAGVPSDILEKVLKSLNLQSAPEPAPAPAPAPKAEPTPAPAPPPKEPTPKPKTPPPAPSSPKGPPQPYPYYYPPYGYGPPPGPGGSDGYYYPRAYPPPRERESTPPPPPPAPAPAPAGPPPKPTRVPSDDSFSTVSTSPEGPLARAPVLKEAPKPGPKWQPPLVDLAPGREPRPSPQLRALLRAVANHLIKNIPPKDSLVLPHYKMIGFYHEFDMEDKEDRDWREFWSHPRLSSMLTQLSVEHHLISPTPGRLAEPTMVALTPTGVETWFFTLLMISPSRESNRLINILTRFPNICAFNNLPTSPLIREFFPPTADTRMAEGWDNVVSRYIGSPASLVIVPSHIRDLNPADYLTPDERDRSAPQPPPPGPPPGPAAPPPSSTAHRYIADRMTLGEDATSPAAPARSKSTRRAQSRHRRGRSVARRAPSPDDYDDDDEEGAYMDADESSSGRGYYGGYYGGAAPPDPRRREPSRPPPPEREWSDRREREKSRPPARADGAEMWRREREREERRYSASTAGPHGSTSGSTHGGRERRSGRWA